MSLFGKMAGNAVAVMSLLAARPGCRLGSAEIAKARSLSPALAAKLLTQLSAAGLVQGQTGPGGGYTLARDPAEISLFQIVALFEQATPSAICPFGRRWCGTGAPCPLHKSVFQILEESRRFLQETRLSVFLPKRQKKIPR